MCPLSCITAHSIGCGESFSRPSPRPAALCPPTYYARWVVGGEATSSHQTGDVQFCCSGHSQNKIPGSSWSYWFGIFLTAPPRAPRSPRMASRKWAPAARPPDRQTACLTSRCASSAVKQFIRNVRASKTIADERAVIQKESASIRASFREESGDHSVRCALRQHGPLLSLPLP